MRILPLILIIIAFLQTSCNEESFEFFELEGTYEGTFIRISANANYTPSQVTLVFSNGQFEGTSDNNRFPAICRGTYTVNGTKVDFVNSCAWSADFDWTLILSGEFTLTQTSDELILQRKNDDSSDLYQLKRQ